MHLGHPQDTTHPYTSRYRASSIPTRRALYSRQKQPLGSLAPDHSLVLLLGLVFSTINPLVVPAAALYFGCAARGACLPACMHA